MNRDDDDNDRAVFKVVVNEDGQYSIWPADRENGGAKRDTGVRGTKAECVAYIEQAGARTSPSSRRKAAEEEMANE